MPVLNRIVLGLVLSAAAVSVATGQTAPARKPISAFGPALGNGTDATAAFAGAMANLTAPTVFIPEGVYTLAGCPSFSAPSAVSFVGSGIGRSVIRLATASTACNGSLFQWINRKSVQIRDLTIDLNGATQVTPQGSAFVLFGADGLVVDHVEIKGAVGPNWSLINVNGGVGGRISNNRTSLKSCSTGFNQGISLSNTFSPFIRWVVDRNTLVNTGLAITPTDDVAVNGNDISGWCYGGGITIAATTAVTNVKIDANIIHESGNAADVNNTLPSGIEDWGPGSTVTNNRIWNVAANCVFFGGRDSYGSGNSCRGWSRGGAGGGYTAYQLFTHGASNASGTRLVGNTATDDGGGTSRYGIADAAGVTDAVFARNTVSGSVAPYRILGGAQVVDPTASTTVGKLGACSMGNKGALMAVADATSTARGSTLTGGGSLRLLARCDGASFKAY